MLNLSSTAFGSLLIAVVLNVANLPIYGLFNHGPLSCWSCHLLISLCSVALLKYLQMKRIMFLYQLVISVFISVISWCKIQTACFGSKVNKLKTGFCWCFVFLVIISGPKSRKMFLFLKGYSKQDWKSAIGLSHGEHKSCQESSSEPSVSSQHCVNGELK